MLSGLANRGPVRSEKEPCRQGSSFVVLSPRRSEGTSEQVDLLVQATLSDSQICTGALVEVALSESCDWDAQMLTSLLHDPAKELSLSGVNQCVGGQDIRERG
jgi:hypothetical protein